MNIVNARTGSLSYSDIQIETACRKLMISVTTDAYTDMPNVKVDLKAQSSSKGTESLWNNIPADALFEIASRTEGVILVETASAQKKYTALCEVSHFGAYFVKDGYLSLSIVTPKTTDIFSVNTIDDAIQSESAVKIESITANANQQKEQIATGYYAIALPASAITGVELRYKGRNVAYTSDECKQLAREYNPLHIVDLTSADMTGLTIGYKNFVVLPLDEVENVRVTLSSTLPFYMVKNIM